MKIQIKYQAIDTPRIEIFSKGDWIDLKSDEDFRGEAPTVKENKISLKTHLLSLGVAMKLPKEFEAVVNPRSSSFSNYGFIMANSQGVIDSAYSGNNDIWKCPCLFLRKSIIKRGDRVCQFRIQPSQFASIWTKLKWVFTNKLEFVEVDNLDDIDRGGFGSTNKQ